MERTKRKKDKMNLENKVRLTEDIVLYKNFLTLDESAKIIKVLDKQAENKKINWTPISFYESYSSVTPQDNDSELKDFDLPSNIFSNMQEKIIEAIASVHEKEINSISKIGFHAQKWEKGAYATLHSDNTDMEGNSGPFERSRYAGFLYLNDTFEGGLLNFPNQNISVQPQTGLLAVFAGGFKNVHEVTLITKGTRYTLGSFWDDREESDYPQEVRDAWAKEMKKIRDKQEETKKEWQDLIKDGYRIDQNGKKYKIEDGE